MFNIESLTELTGTITGSSAQLELLTAEQVSVLLVAESVQDMCRPVRTFSQNVRIAEQQRFNRAIALMVKDGDGSTADLLGSLAMQAATRVQAAQQADEPEAVQEAIERLEKVLNFYADLASNVARNSFYRYEECEKQETAAHDSHVDGIDGAKGAFETRSKYAGWKTAIVECDAMYNGAREAVDNLLQLIGAVIPLASAYFRQLMTTDKSEVLVQLGYRRQPESKEGEVEYIRFYTVEDVWADIKANRKVADAPMTAAAAVAAFKL